MVHNTLDNASALTLHHYHSERTVGSHGTADHASSTLPFHLKKYAANATVQLIFLYSFWQSYDEAKLCSLLMSVVLSVLDLPHPFVGVAAF